MSPSSLDELIEALRCLPGVGPKSAQRMAYHLLQRDQRGAARLGNALLHALEVLRHCARCNSFTEDEVCPRCANPRRDAALLCVVEMPADLAMIEQTQSYNGLYYVLMGRLSPLDGVGPRELRLDKLIARATEEGVREVILATNFTNEGEAPRTPSRACSARAGSRSAGCRAASRSAASSSIPTSAPSARL